MKPKVFIGSSVESRKIAYAIQENLEYDADCKVWTQGVFELSGTAIHSLIKELESSDFAIFVFSPDDITQIRDQSKTTVRDNVIFETGLFIGKIGIERVYFVIPSGSNGLHLPSDLLGITPGHFDDSKRDLVSALGTFCNKVRRQIEALGFFESKVVSEIKQVKVDNYEYTENHKELDKSICQEIKRLLPINGSILFIRENNFSGFHFQHSLLDDLNRYIYEGDNVSLEFINKELEELRADLSTNIRKFLSLIAKNTWVSKTNSDYSSVPPEWEEEQPERFNRVVGEIHNLSEQICTTYDLWVRKCKIILAV